MTENKLDRVTIGESDFSPYSEINYDEHLVWVNISLKGSESLKSEIQQAIEKAEKWDWYEYGRKDKAHAQGLEDCTGYAYDKIKELQQQIKQLQEDNKGLLKVMETYDDRDNRDIVELKQENQQLKESITKLRKELLTIGTERDELKEKLEKIREWHQTYNYDTKDGFRYLEFDELKQILDSEPTWNDAFSEERES